MMHNIYSLNQLSQPQNPVPVQLRVLVVDDNAIDLMLHKRIVAHHMPNCNTIGFQHAANALQYLMEHEGEATYTLILLDIQMPEMDGYEFVAHLHNCPPTVKEKCIIVMVSSAHDEYNHIVHPSLQLVKQKLPKPLVPASFKDVMNNILLHI
ncbi:response regulator receiver domain-containing protein [Chitinophaga skermanii]|uniref:Response regulator receiver domain-containing protein n=1 Tax=Chitinophaga skermanii TaxID=331697 RepID=A0A327QJ12_9BACT|nr:response regulator [Chitinophaga skermanii]RAJ04251.1 response regulator receiver domain-containing protein [Chitinophaga skermanii]